MKKMVIALYLICASTVFAEDQLNLFIWSEYIDPEIVGTFEKKFHAKVVIDLYEDEEGMMAKLQGGGDSIYDVVVPPDHIVPALVQRKLIAPLTKEHIPNLANIDSKFINPPFDRDNNHTVPYQWGTLGIYMRKAKDQQVDESWALIFDPAKQSGKFLLIDAMRDSIGAALKYKGYSINSIDPKQLAEARNVLASAKNRAQGIVSGVGGKNKVLAKEVSVAIAYNGDAARGMEEDPDTYYFIPREGGEIWVDSLAIPAKAPHRDLAEKFINFILEPEIGAKLSNFNSYATPNKASIPLINPEDRRNPAIYPPPEIMSKLEFIQDLGPQTTLYDDIWTALKAS